MNAYRDFINTIVFEANPNQNLDRSFPTNLAGGNALLGRFTFLTNIYSASSGLRCNTCHALPTGSDLLIDPKEVLPTANDLKVPHLRNLYQKTPAPRPLSVTHARLTRQTSTPRVFPTTGRCSKRRPRC
jgi:hypothetical protein